jgi:PST family polysaccharide transporter
MGGAQAINIAVGLAKMKAVALLLGPMGIGLAGLYLNIVQTGAAVAGLGLSNVGTRQISAAHASGGDIAVGRTRRALFWGTTALAVLGAAVFWLASGWIARSVLGDVSHSREVAWLSIGVALAVAGGSQAALLTGLRRIGDLARVNVGAGVTGAVFGVLAIWLWGAKGIVAMVVIAPAATCLLALWYVARLGRPAGPQIRWRELAAEWRNLAHFGIAFMFSGLITTLGQLVARTLIQRELGLDALGQFQASWAIGMTYLSFVLGAMGTDYYPRVTAAIEDEETATRLANEQTEVALLLCAPPILAMLGFAPWVVNLLYSNAFASAAEVLRWQLLGDVFKILSWPLGFVILARGAGKTFVGIESLGMAVFLLGIYVGMPFFDVVAAGMSFIALYVTQLVVTWWLAARHIGFRWSGPVKLQALAVIGAAVTVNAAATWSNLLGAIIGGLFAFMMAMAALIRLSALIDPHSYIGQIARRISKRITRPRSNEI